MKINNLQKTILEELRELKKSKKSHFELLDRILQADNGYIYPLDLLVFAVIQRSVSLIDGFSLLVKKENVLCANPLLRLQVDTILRLYACSLVDDSHSIAIAILRDKPLNKVVSIEGYKLTDKNIRKKANENLPWLDNVYKITSGYVHLSAIHITSIINNVESELSDEVYLSKLKIGVGQYSRKWDKNDILESVRAFRESTNCIIQLCEFWFYTKSSKSKEANQKWQDFIKNSSGLFYE